MLPMHLNCYSEIEQLISRRNSLWQPEFPIKCIPSLQFHCKPSPTPHSLNRPTRDYCTQGPIERSCKWNVWGQMDEDSMEIKMRAAKKKKKTWLSIPSVKHLNANWIWGDYDDGRDRVRVSEWHRPNQTGKGVFFRTRDRCQPGCSLACKDIPTFPCNNSPYARSEVLASTWLKIRSSRIWRYVGWSVVTKVWDELPFSIFRVYGLGLHRLDDEDYIHSEYGGRKLLPNIGNYLPTDITSYPKRPNLQSLIL